MPDYSFERRVHALECMRIHPEKERARAKESETCCIIYRTYVYIRTYART